MSKSFNEKLTETQELSYLTHNNMAIGFIILGDELMQKYGDHEWKNKLKEILKNINFQKSNPIWKTIGIENNPTLPTIKKIANHFRKLTQEGVVENV